MAVVCRRVNHLRIVINVSDGDVEDGRSDCMVSLKLKPQHRRWLRDDEVYVANCLKFSLQGCGKLWLSSMNFFPGPQK